MRILRWALAVVVGVALAAGADVALAKSKKPKNHITFTERAITYVAKKRKKVKTPTATNSIFGAGFLDLMGDAAGPKEVRYLRITIAKIDFAAQTYPVELAAGQVSSMVYHTENLPGGAPQLTGHWVLGSGATATVTLDSYDRKKRRLVGRFVASLKNGLAGGGGFLPIESGAFQVTLPKN